MNKAEAKKALEYLWLRPGLRDVPLALEDALAILDQVEGIFPKFKVGETLYWLTRRCGTHWAARWDEVSEIFINRSSIYYKVFGRMQLLDEKRCFSSLSEAERAAREANLSPQTNAQRFREGQE